jgi:predicted dehydrogenase
MSLSAYDKCLGGPQTFLTASYSMDRYRNALKGTWKDEARPAAGQMFDLGSHLIDQTLTLFGRPASVTAIAENVRGAGSPDVDDSVRAQLLFILHPAPSLS